ncbi:hypothetical protein [Pantoea stewartii]|nr:hypothetical protein [Pantoea stewartii]
MMAQDDERPSGANQWFMDKIAVHILKSCSSRVASGITAGVAGVVKSRDK